MDQLSGLVTGKSAEEVWKLTYRMNQHLAHLVGNDVEMRFATQAGPQVISAPRLEIPAPAPVPTPPAPIVLQYRFPTKKSAENVDRQRFWLDNWQDFFNTSCIYGSLPERAEKHPDITYAILGSAFTAFLFAKYGQFAPKADKTNLMAIMLAVVRADPKIKIHTKGYTGFVLRTPEAERNAATTARPVEYECPDWIKEKIRLIREDDDFLETFPQAWNDPTAFILLYEDICRYRREASVRPRIIRDPIGQDEMRQFMPPEPVRRSPRVTDGFSKTFPDFQRTLEAPERPSERRRRIQEERIQEQREAEVRRRTRNYVQLEAQAEDEPQTQTESSSDEEKYYQ